ncbi:response regulator [Bacillus massiliigorillae]|uniref:response regulator n=1 Tax=Bacillus massiliigorillae TaxID=1243664 RepID=UPI0018A84BC1|nr:response regulator [Bacillus massiliigorillae]
MNIQNQLTFPHGFLGEQQLATFFKVLTANVGRSRSPITATILTLRNHEFLNENDYLQIEEEMGAFLQSKIRQSDVICQLANPFEWCIILTQSGEKEAIAFINRVQSDIQNKTNPLFIKYDFSILASVAEINNSDATFDEVIKTSRQLLSNSLDKSITFTSQFKERKIEHIKFSILEENEIFSQALYTTLDNLPINHFLLDIKIFRDGYEFLQSDWYHTSHTHIILVNDILPRKNGLEVVHRIRELPNHNKFIIFMMTKRKSEQDMIHAFESGVDEYLIKPFNIRIFEAQMKRVLERLWF